MNDDFGTRGALAAIDDLAGTVADHVRERDEYDYPGLRDAIETLESLGGDVLGLQFTETPAAPDEEDRVPRLVELVLETREQARENGNYGRADTLRDRLESLGVEVEDTSEGPTYRL